MLLKPCVSTILELSMCSYELSCLHEICTLFVPGMEHLDITSITDCSREGPLTFWVWQKIYHSNRQFSEPTKLGVWPVLLWSHFNALLDREMTTRWLSSFVIQSSLELSSFCSIHTRWKTLKMMVLSLVSRPYCNETVFVTAFVVEWEWSLECYQTCMLETSFSSSQQNVWR